MSPRTLRIWRRRTFPAPTEKASLERAAKWYGIKSIRAWQYWESGDRPIPVTLELRIREAGGP